MCAVMQQRRQVHLLSMTEQQVSGQWKVEYKGIFCTPQYPDAATLKHGFPRAVNGEVKGSGIAPRKGAAQEAAAQQALRNLGVNV